MREKKQKTRTEVNSPDPDSDMKRPLIVKPI